MSDQWSPPSSASSDSPGMGLNLPLVAVPQMHPLKTRRLRREASTKFRDPNLVSRADYRQMLFCLLPSPLSTSLYLSNPEIIRSEISIGPPPSCRIVAKVRN